MVRAGKMKKVRAGQKEQDNASIKGEEVLKFVQKM